MISIIAAVSKNGVIGNKGKIPWNLPSDLKRFKLITEYSPVVMGRKTWESLGEKKLKNRLNCIITSRVEDNNKFKFLNYDSDPVFFKNHRRCISCIEKYHEGSKEIFIIGGESLYREYISRADNLYISHVGVECEGDAFFPEIPDYFSKICCEKVIDNNVPYEFAFYKFKGRNFLSTTPH